MRTHSFETLDGIRGSAAIAVAALHAGLMFPPILVPSAYLAVDLFFLLSGVVLEHAYGKRFARGG
jgi:peptidoglycan/LPS O-acetylase OafA/YrhL